MPGDVRGRVPDPSSMSSGNRRSQHQRRPHPQYSSENSQNNHNVPSQSTTTFHYSQSSSYTQRSGFFGQQYTISPHAPQLGMTHSPPYPYPHGYQHPAVPPDTNMMSQNIHATYPHLMTPSVYPFQRQSSEGTGSGFSNPNLYHPSQSNPSSVPMSPQPSAHNQYAPGQFQSLRYPSPLPSQQYPYSTPPYSPTSIYQSQFNPAYPRPYASPETEGQGTWWYLPHAAPLPSHQYGESAPPSYPATYQMNYSPVSHQDIDRSFAHSPASASGPSSTTMYPMSSVRPSPHSHASPPPSSISPPPVAPPDPPPTPPLKPDGSSPSKQQSEKPTVSVPSRRPYHPNPPTHRSEWVMWSGNVPSDATHDELWRFFNQPPSSHKSDEPWSSGVLSIFLISRSSCAFVNYEGEAYLQDAITRFNGMPLRSQDPRCPRLVCRVRKKDDDLKAGVGGQRGVGMHTKWIKDQRGKWQGPASEPSDAEDSSSSLATPKSVSSDDERIRPLVPRSGRHSNSSGSYASTTSSVFAKYFPKRFFILKSLSQYDLDLSVEKGLWATQKHNEGILDQAYRTSTDVYLIFGVNKSGEFYGYARMAGPVSKGEHRVSWGPRTDSSSSTRSSVSPITGRGPVHSDTIFEEPASPTRVLGEGYSNMTLSDQKPHVPFLTERIVEDSPQPVTSLGSPGEGNVFGAITPDEGSGVGESADPGLLVVPPIQSAPAELGGQHRKITMQTPTAKFSLDNMLKQQRPKSVTVLERFNEDFQLDEEAPIRAVKNASVDGIHPDGEMKTGARSSSRGLQGEGSGKGKGQAKDASKEDTWGESFKVDWICVERLPFYRTRHIRNPWNHDREIKVSRDGTELEPGVGQQLLDEWEKFVAEGGTAAAAAVGVADGANKSAPPANKPSTVTTPSSKPSQAPTKRTG
ncbi:yt521-b-like splicing protein [Moniliophthora roreri MCA 2997]|uniref:Yt521-b-like splicing protein n=2 Tax=Moniliophthora roreri TaxID=221103 RepID=V2WZC4_MONRO|nr:yt521-b-like splicing protein [Moniliophthora roreri MCA 2997]